MGFGGYGGNPYADLFGSGGPLYVARAGAVAGQTVRVVFDEEPIHRTPSGVKDALNPANYIFTVVGGAATAPVPVGVDPDLVVGPTYGVGNGTDPDAVNERGLDVHVDRQLIAGITYNVRVRNVEALAGGVLGYPYEAQFPGVTRLQVTRPPQRHQDLVDIANPGEVGHWLVDDSGDYAPEDPAAGTRKRIWRRITTPTGSFSHIPNYGVAVRLKDLSNVTSQIAYRNQAQEQILREPDVAEASVVTRMDATGLFTVEVRAKTVRGRIITSARQFGSDGAPVIA